MKITNGKVIAAIGVIHTVLTLLLPVYQKPISFFTRHWFFSISGGPLDSPETMGAAYYENFAAFWCLYFGLFVIPLGILVEAVEKRGLKIPYPFLWSYLVVVLMGSYMIPLSGMTLFFLPNGIYMLYKYRKQNNK